MDLGSKKRIGNFVLTKKRDGKSTFIIARTLRGEWETRFRADDRMFGLFNDLGKEDEDSVHTLLSTMLAVCHIVEAGFTKDVIGAVNAYSKRVQGGGEEESQRIVGEERRVYEMRKEAEDGKE